MRTYSPAYLSGSVAAIARVRAACADLATADPTQSEDARLGYLQTLARVETLVLGLPGGDAIRETLIVDRGGYLPREAVGQTPREVLRETLEREERRVAGWPPEVRAAVGLHDVPGFSWGYIVDKGPSEPATAPETPAAPSPLPDPPEPATASPGPFLPLSCPIPDPPAPRHISRDDFERLMREGAEASRAAAEVGAETRFTSFSQGDLDVMDRGASVDAYWEMLERARRAAEEAGR